jgi:hypothetical protein
MALCPDLSWGLSPIARPALQVSNHWISNWPLLGVPRDRTMLGPFNDKVLDSGVCQNGLRPLHLDWMHRNRETNLIATMVYEALAFFTQVCHRSTGLCFFSSHSPNSNFLLCIGCCPLLNLQCLSIIAQFERKCSTTSQALYFSCTNNSLIH